MLTKKAPILIHNVNVSPFNEVYNRLKFSFMDAQLPYLLTKLGTRALIFALKMKLELGPRLLKA